MSDMITNLNDLQLEASEVVRNAVAAATATIQGLLQELATSKSQAEKAANMFNEEAGKVASLTAKLEELQRDPRQGDRSSQQIDEA